MTLSPLRLCFIPFLLKTICPLHFELLLFPLFSSYFLSLYVVGTMFWRSAVLSLDSSCFPASFGHL